MIEYKTSPRARILFVGINSHPGSDRRGVPFSNNKTFWYLLNPAGLLQEAVDDLKDNLKLKEIYDTRFIEKYDPNFVNLGDRPTVDVPLLKKEEEQPGICVSDSGCQEEILGTKVYLMHFPIRGPAEVRVNDLRAISEASSPARTDDAQAGKRSRSQPHKYRKNEKRN